MPLHDVPPDAVGISCAEWIEHERECIFAEAREGRKKLPDGQPVSGAPRRDRGIAAAQPLFSLHGSYEE